MTTLNGRIAIAQALSGITGVPVSVHQVDRLEARGHDPLPVKGYMGRKWAALDELQAWWEEERRRVDVATATRRMERVTAKRVKRSLESRGRDR